MQNSRMRDSHVAAATVSDLWERTITLNGFSKAYAMTGWRVGYLCAPKETVRGSPEDPPVCDALRTCNGAGGALEAIRSAEEDKNNMVNEYRLRRNMFVAGLNRIGLPTHVPEGAFYAFPSVKDTGLSDTEFAERLLKEQRVAVVPGSVFGPGGRIHLRCAYAVSRKATYGSSWQNGNISQWSLTVSDKTRQNRFIRLYCKAGSLGYFILQLDQYYLNYNELHDHRWWIFWG